MAFVQSDLDAINEAIASGARRVRFQTHEVEYQSLGDLIKARDIIREEIEGSRSRIVFTEFHGGR